MLVVDEEQKLSSQNLGKSKQGKKGISKIVIISVGIILAVALIITLVLLLKKKA